MIQTGDIVRVACETREYRVESISPYQRVGTHETVNHARLKVIGEAWVKERVVPLDQLVLSRQARPA